MSKKIVYTTNICNPWHGQVKPDTRRKVNTDKKKKGK